jgi:hypothetical protein
MACEYTWEWKGLKTKIIGMEEKRQVTICVSFASDGSLLLMQIIFVGKTNRCLPRLQMQNCVWTLASISQ